MVPIPTISVVPKLCESSVEGKSSKIAVSLWFDLDQLRKKPSGSLFGILRLNEEALRGSVKVTL